LICIVYIEMSLFASLDVANPQTTQSGALFAPVIQRNLGCTTGNSSGTHTVGTVVQNGLARKTRKGKNSKGKGKGKRKYKRTMNKRRNKRTRSKVQKRKKSRTRKHKNRRHNQVGRGTSYQNVLENTPNMAPQGAAPSYVAEVNTGAV
jgi:hypothetical protein